MGVIIDEASDVVEIFPEEVQAATNLPTNFHREYLKGVGKKADEMIVLLDIDRSLSLEELEQTDAT